MQTLIARLDNPADDLSDIMADNLFQIKVEKYYVGDENVPPKSCLELADDTTDAGAYLIWEFNQFTLEMNELDETNTITPELARTLGFRYRRFVELLERLEISTGYDCWDSYGTMSQNPREAIFWHLCFEADTDYILGVVEPIAQASNLLSIDAYNDLFDIDVEDVA